MRAVIAALALLAACTGAAGTAGEELEPSESSLIELENRARALANATGCGPAAACAVAPVGSRPCGGPRDHLVYCPATTDTAALFGVLAQLEQAERAYNEAHGLVSTCELRLPPEVVSDNGVCRATTGP